MVQRVYGRAIAGEREPLAHDIPDTQQAQMKGKRPDLSQWLIDGYIEGGSSRAELSWLHGDAVSIIVAGRLEHHPTKPLCLQWLTIA